MVATVAYNGVSLDVAPYSIETVEGLIGAPEIRSTDQPYVGRSGLVLGRDFYLGRTVTLTVNVHANDLTQFGTAVAALSRAFVAPRDTELPLTFTVPGVADGVAARLNCRPRRMAFPQPAGSYFMGVGQAVIELYATDPNVYANTLSSTVTTVVLGAGGFTWPFTWPLTWPGAAASGAVLNNAGNAPAMPTVRFDGPLTNPSITNINTGQQVSLAITIAAGDWVDLDFANRAVLLNGSVNRYPYLDVADWWALAPGNTTVALTADSGAGTATISWRSAWL